MPQTPTMLLEVPATSANLGSGFDSFGLALSLYNRFSLRLLGQDEPDFPVVHDRPYPIIWSAEEGIRKYLTWGPENLLLRSLLQVMTEADLSLPPVAIGIESRVPPGRGLGSSATAIVGGLFLGRELVRHLGGRRFTLEELQFLAAAIEGHPDNVTPAIFGGFCFGFGDRPGQFLRYDLPADLKVAIIVPDYPLSTEKARAVIPAAIPLRDCVANLRASALWIEFLHSGKSELLRLALRDRVHEPYRETLIPEYAPVRAILERHGCEGTVISGAGPSLIAFYRTDAPNDALREAIRAEYRKNGATASVIDITPDAIGVKLLKSLSV